MASAREAGFVRTPSSREVREQRQTRPFPPPEERCRWPLLRCRLYRDQADQGHLDTLQARLAHHES
eukprot:1548901-Prymnesium_polylepis.1